MLSPLSRKVCGAGYVRLSPSWRLISEGKGNEKGQIYCPESFPSNFFERVVVSMLEEDEEAALWGVVVPGFKMSVRGSPWARVQLIMGWLRKVRLPPSYEPVTIFPIS
jgi:hypothetical protein